MRNQIISDNSFSPLKISVMGFSDSAVVTRFGPGRRDFYIVHYVTEGKGYYNGNSVTAGQGFLIYPGQREEYYPDENDPWEFLWAVSTDAAMKELFPRYNADKNTQIFSFKSVNTAKEIMNKIMLHNHRITDALKVTELYLRLLNSHTSVMDLPKNKASSEMYLDFCVNYIENNIYNKITVEELCSLAGVSQPYLYKIFKDTLGMSTKDYIVQHKMNRAKELLLETDMSITKISNSVGYSDSLSFSKAFSLFENMSPKKYRQMKQGAQQ